MGNSSLRKNVALAVDLGGTHLKSGVVAPSGRILHQESVSSGSKEKKEKILQQILEAVSRQERWAKTRGYRALGIGFGIPGIVSFPQGVVFRSPQFPDWRDYPLREKLKHHLVLPFTLDNDANMAALGEGWIGSARRKKNFMLITLGTGIGGGIVLEGKLLHGDSGFAGELGHLVIEREGRACQCGGRGCLEMYASAVGLREEWKERSRKGKYFSASGLRLLASSASSPTPEVLYRLARRGDRTAQRIYDCFGKALGAGIATAVNVLDIEFVILGGGLSGAWPEFIESTRSAIQAHLYSTTARRLRLVRARLGNDAGLVGAARSVFLQWAGQKG
jgi:glucokinase